MSKHTLVVGAIITLLVAMAHVVLADVPQLISFQGKLHDNVGDPLTGQYQITFRIYNVEEGGTAVWTETSTVSCDNGLYNVILGMTTPMTLGFDGDFWLSVQVAGDTELTPRFRIVSVPVAIRAAVADVAQQVSWNNLSDVPAGFADGTDDVGSGGGVSQINAGTGIIVTNPTGPTTTVAANVGTGASQVAAGNHEHDDRYYTETELRTNDGTVNQAGDPVSWTKIKDIPAGFADGTDNTGGGGGAGGWVDDGSVVRLENSSANVGIGTANPLAKLHLYGDDPILRVSDSSSGESGRGPACLKLERGGMGKDRAQVVYSDGPTSRWHAGLMYNNGKPTPYFHISQREYIYNGTSVHIPEFTITTEGYVGIGTAGPTNLLELHSNSPKLYFNRVSSTSNFAGLYWRSTDDNFEGAFVRNNGTGDIELYTNISGGTPRMVVTNAGDVGVGTSIPAAKMDVNGDLTVAGAYRGTIASSSGSDGAPFPRPAYDSGWVYIPKGETSTFTHNIGGNIDNYVVDVSFYLKDQIAHMLPGPHHIRYGGIEMHDSNLGADWHSLTNQIIKVSRLADDVHCVRARVRIWVYN